MFSEFNGDMQINVQLISNDYLIHSWCNWDNVYSIDEFEMVPDDADFNSNGLCTDCTVDTPDGPIAAPELIPQYGNFTEASVSPQRAQSLEVQIDFSHGDKLFRASRSYDQNTKTTHSLRLTEIVEGGEVPIPNVRPDRFINSVIPSEMAPHFFFWSIV